MRKSLLLLKAAEKYFNSIHPKAVPARDQCTQPTRPCNQGRDLMYADKPADYIEGKQKLILSFKIQKTRGSGNLVMEKTSMFENPKSCARKETDRSRNLKSGRE